MAFSVNTFTINSSQIIPRVPLIITDGLQARYLMNDGTGTNLGDSYGSNNGTMYSFDNPPTATSSWSGSSALSFDGVSDYVDLGSGLNVSNKSFSISVWTTRRSNGVWGLVASQGSATSTNQILHVGYRDTNAFTLAFYADDLTTDGTYNDVGAGWIHWVVTYDSTNREQRIYRNGASVVSRTSNGQLNATGNVVIGRRMVAEGGAQGAALLWFGGSMKDWRVYYRKLSSVEVSSIYNGTG